VKLVAEAVNVTRVNAECDDCGGIFRARSVVRNPKTLYKHECIDCGNKMESDYEYPRIVYTTQTSMPLTTDMLDTSIFNRR
jgi:hypothetical protein